MRHLLQRHLVALLLGSLGAFCFSAASPGDRPVFVAEVRLTLGDAATLEMTAVPFDPQRHKVTTCQILDWSGVCLIDGHPVFGTDWEVPQSQLMKATLKLGEIRVDLDVSCMFNPWTTVPRREDFSLQQVEGGHVLRGRFSDGAGSYEVEWLVIENVAVRTLLRKTEC